MKYTKKIESEIAKLMESAKITKNTSYHKRYVLPKLLANKTKYQRVSRETGVPTVMVMLIHTLENARDLGKFKAYLGNGEPFNKRTKKVPRGRGPFASWENGAIDALRLRKLDKIKEWSSMRMFHELELYNGLGYEYRNMESPYIWSYSNHYTKGKFVSDGKFDSNKVSKQMGAYPLYQLLVERDESLSLGHLATVDESKFNIIEWIVNFLLGLFTSNKHTSANEAADKTRNYLVLERAAAELGTKEVPGSGSNVRVEEYLAWGGSKNNNIKLKDSVPWCAGFLGWCLEKVGMGSTNSLLARSYENWGVKVSNSQALPGDIGVWYRSGLASGKGHTAFLVKIVGDYGYFVGGNQDNEVNVTRYYLGKIGTKGFLGFRRSSKAGKYSEKQIQDLMDLRDKILDGEIVKASGSVV